MRVTLLFMFFVVTIKSFGQNLSGIPLWEGIKGGLESDQIIENRPSIVIHAFRSSDSEVQIYADYFTSALEITLQSLDYFNIVSTSSGAKRNPAEKIQTPGAALLSLSGFVTNQDDKIQITFEITDAQTLDVVLMEEMPISKDNSSILRELKDIPGYRNIKSISGGIFNACLRLSQKLISITRIKAKNGGQPTQDLFSIN